jgi:Arc/MetJ family transcription regulator
MRMTVDLDEQLVEEAQRLTGTRDLTALVHDGLRVLIARKSARRLAALGGSDPKARAPRRSLRETHRATLASIRPP